MGGQRVPCRLLCVRSLWHKPVVSRRLEPRPEGWGRRNGVKTFNDQGLPSCGDCLHKPLSHDLNQLNSDQDIKRVRQQHTATQPAVQPASSPVAQFLGSIGVPADLIANVEAAGVMDIETLGILTRDDLTDRIGLPLGYAAKIVHKLNEEF